MIEEKYIASLIVLIINASFVQALISDLVDLQAIDSTGKIIK